MHSRQFSPRTPRGRLLARCFGRTPAQAPRAPACEARSAASAAGAVGAGGGAGGHAGPFGSTEAGAPGSAMQGRATGVLSGGSQRLGLRPQPKKLCFTPGSQRVVQRLGPSGRGLTGWGRRLGLGRAQPRQLAGMQRPVRFFLCARPPRSVQFSVPGARCLASGAPSAGSVNVAVGCVTKGCADRKSVV